MSQNNRFYHQGINGELQSSVAGKGAVQEPHQAAKHDRGAGQEECQPG